METLKNRMNMTRNSCVIPKPILVLACLATLCLMSQKLRFVYNECRNANRPLADLLAKENNSLHNIAHYPVSHSNRGLELYIYSAFLDTRFSKKIVRIFALEHRDGTGETFRCKWTFYDESTDEWIFQEVQAKRYLIDTSWPEWSLYFASEYDCLLPVNTEILNNVTLGNENGKFSFKIKVEHFAPHPRRRDLAVCVKPTSGFLHTHRTLEWLETLIASGYTDVIVYNADISGPGRHVLDYYVENGFVTIMKFPFLMSVVQLIDRNTADITPQQRFGIYEQIYLIGVHDCLYRFSSHFRYITFLGLDEVILPEADESITNTLRRAEADNPYAGAFLFLTSWHWDENPQNGHQTKTGSDNKISSNLNIFIDLYLPAHAQGTQPVDKHAISIASTDRVITMNLHEILDVAKKDYHSITLPSDKFGMTHHFRTRCGNEFDFLTCESMKKNMKKSKAVLRYEKEVQATCNKIANHLQLL